jgi:hypothetical protein
MVGFRRLRFLLPASVVCVVLALLAPGTAAALTYSGPTNFSAGSAPTGIASGLFNADGNTDLAVANDGSHNVSILLGNGTGGFTGPTNFAAGTNPTAVATGLFNADANIDLAVANDGSNSVSVLLGNGTGGFGGPTGFNVGFAPLDVAVGKFNADANNDLVVANEASNDVSVLLGNGTGGFGTAANYPAASGPGSVAVGQFNADANEDLAVSNDFSNNVSILLGNGAGGFGSPTNFPVGAAPAEVTTGHFNGDTNIDLAVANASNSVSILLGNGAGVFSAATSFAAGSGPSGVVPADLDDDSHVDLAVSNDLSNNVSVLLGNAAGGFIAPSNFGAGSGPASIVAAHFNADPRLDLAVANEASNNVSVLLNNSPTGFPRPKGASPLRTSLVPAYVECTSPNEGHGPPLSFGSCKPPVQASGFVTVGTPDANGGHANSTGSVIFRVKVNPSPPNDLQIDATITDVRCKLPVTTTCGDPNSPGGPDYAGAVRQLFSARITDMSNSVGGGTGTASGTLQDMTPLQIDMPCAGTAMVTQGATCSVSTTANSLVPGIAEADKRAIWAMDRIRIVDGGADGDPATAGNSDFARSGIFVP